jgi:hypothetical protein
MREVRTLICHRDVPMGLRCLPSLSTYSQEPVRLVVHDDGTLDPQDVVRIEEALPGSRLVSRSESDDRMADVLRHHPVSARFRREHPLGLKLLDTTLMCADPVVRYCDADVMFFRPFSHLFELHDSDALFMADTHDAYSWRSWEMWRWGLRVVNRANTGLMAFRTQCFDLDRAEWVLRQPVRQPFRHFIEQTAWAVLAAPLRVRQWAPAHVRIVADGVRRPESLVAGHFIGPFRHLLDGLRESDFTSPSAPPVRLESRPARTIGPVEYGVREAKRLWATRLGRQRAPGHDAYLDWT